MLLSVIIPCYNGQEVLPVFYQEFKKVMQDMPAEYELLFIDDGSKDGTLEILRSLSRKDSHVSYLSFSRNFGKEAAMYAGFCNVHGDYAAVMDAGRGVNFSQVPLSLASWSGLFMTAVSFLAVAVVAVRRLVWGDPVAGWASTVCVITLIGGIQLFCMGIIGQYISKIYLEVKKRPHYIVAESSLSVSGIREEGGKANGDVRFLPDVAGMPLCRVDKKTQAEITGSMQAWSVRLPGGETKGENPK